MSIRIEPACFDPPTNDNNKTPYFHIVLVEPEIPPNTGSIARLSAATGAWLHLVRPLGYELSDRHLKRAGLDYWPNVRLSVHDSAAAIDAILPWDRTWIFTKTAARRYTDVDFPPGTILVFGRESCGLPEDWVERRSDRALNIPQSDNVRSLNIAQAAAVASYEVIRQNALL